MSNKTLIISGFFIPVVFWTTLFVCGLMTEGYSHKINMVSELGALNSHTQHLFTAGLILSALLSGMCAIGLYNTARKAQINTLPILLLFTFTFSIAGAALFPMPLRWHGILGSPSILLPLSPLLALVFWKNTNLPGIKRDSAIILAIMVLGFCVFFPEVLAPYFGLKQRFFHIGWTLWFVYLSYRFLTLQQTKAK